MELQVGVRKWFQTVNVCHSRVRALWLFWCKGPNKPSMGHDLTDLNQMCRASRPLAATPSGWLWAMIGVFSPALLRLSLPTVGTAFSALTFIYSTSFVKESSVRFLDKYTNPYLSQPFEGSFRMCADKCLPHRSLSICRVLNKWI